MTILMFLRVIFEIVDFEYKKSEFNDAKQFLFLTKSQKEIKGAFVIPTSNKSLTIKSREGNYIQ